MSYDPYKDKKFDKKKEKEVKELQKDREKELKKQEKDVKKMQKHSMKGGYPAFGVGPGGISVGGAGVGVVGGHYPPGVVTHGHGPVVGVVAGHQIGTPLAVGAVVGGVPKGMAYNPQYGAGGGAGVDPQVQQWFAAVDQDRSGRITASELGAALQSSNGQKFSEAACRLMIGMFDQGAGSIDINGFSHLFGYVNQWLNAFRAYDQDQSGFINSTELASALQTMGYRFSQPFVDMLATRFGDKRGAGLPVDGFIMSCILIQKFTDGFRQKDTQQQGVITIAYEDFLSMILSAWA